MDLRNQNEDCSRRTFIQDYTYQAYYPVVQRQISDMAMNGSGIRDTARVLKISPTTVIKSLKKSSKIQAINEPLLAQIDPSQTQVLLLRSDELEREAELDEMGRFVQSKENQRWLWWAIDHSTGEVLAYILSDHKDQAFIELKKLLEPFEINHFYTDGWGAYQRHLEADIHSVGKRNTQKIERKHLTLLVLI